MNEERDVEKLGGKLLLKAVKKFYSLSMLATDNRD